MRLKTRIADTTWRCSCCGAQNDQRGCVKGPPNCWCVKDGRLFASPLRCAKCQKCPPHCRCNDDQCNCRYLRARFEENFPPGHSPQCPSRNAFVEYCDHKWVGHKNPNTPDGPGEYVKFCDNCGAEWTDDDAQQRPRRAGERKRGATNENL